MAVACPQGYKQVTLSRCWAESTASAATGRLVPVRKGVMTATQRPNVEATVIARLALAATGTLANALDALGLHGRSSSSSAPWRLGCALPARR